MKLCGKGEFDDTKCIEIWFSHLVPFIFKHFNYLFVYGIKVTNFNAWLYDSYNILVESVFVILVTILFSFTDLLNFDGTLKYADLIFCYLHLFLLLF